MKKIWISSIVGIIISGVSLYYVFQNIPVSDIVTYFFEIDYAWTFISIVICFVSFLLRVYRWQIIIKSLTDISFISVYHASSIGFMMNNIFPARIGEIARPLLLKESGIPISSLLATVAAERMFDLITLLSCFIVVFNFVEIDPLFQIQFSDIILNKATLEFAASNMTKLAIALMILIIILSVEKIKNQMKRLILNFPKLIFFVDADKQNKITSKIFIPITKVIELIASGFTVLKSPLKIFLCSFLSFLIWILIVISCMTFAKACKGIDLTMSEMIVVEVILCFFVSLPSAPGFWGLWEAGSMFGLALFGITGKDAAGFTLLNHVVQIIPVTLVGLVSAAIIGSKVFNVCQLYKK